MTGRTVAKVANEIIGFKVKLIAPRWVCCSEALSPEQMTCKQQLGDHQVAGSSSTTSIRQRSSSAHLAVWSAEPRPATVPVAIFFEIAPVGISGAQQISIGFVIHAANHLSRTRVARHGRRCADAASESCGSLGWLRAASVRARDRDAVQSWRCTSFDSAPARRPLAATRTFSASALYNINMTPGFSCGQRPAAGARQFLGGTRGIGGLLERIHY